mmetsp:Transcript_112464/g.324902  ORF Transcript_112464/g.324902 Transcript_112464/m.324902 type:complete len:239 (-) Transcript_112464:443-1159(-)
MHGGWQPPETRPPERGGGPAEATGLGCRLPLSASISPRGHEILRSLRELDAGMTAIACDDLADARLPEQGNKVLHAHHCVQTREDRRGYSGGRSNQRLAIGPKAHWGQGRRGPCYVLRGLDARLHVLACRLGAGAALPLAAAPELNRDSLRTAHRRLPQGPKACRKLLKQRDFSGTGALRCDDPLDGTSNLRARRFQGRRMLHKESFERLRVEANKPFLVARQPCCRLLSIFLLTIGC